MTEKIATLKSCLPGNFHKILIFSTVTHDILQKLALTAKVPGDGNEQKNSTWKQKQRV